MKKQTHITNFNFALQLLDFVDIEEATEHITSIIENLPIPIWAYNDEGNIIFWNKESEKIFGSSSFQILGKPDHLTLFRPIKEEKVTNGYQKQFISQKGKSFILHLQFLRKQNKKLNYIWLFGYEITQYKNYENSIIQKINHYQNIEKILNRSDSFIYIRENDLDWSITYVSANFYHFIGEPQVSNQNQPISFVSYIHPEDIGRIKAEILIAEHERWDQMHLEYRIFNTYNKTIWVSDSMEMIRNQKGNVVKYQGVITNITYQKKAEVKIKEQHQIIRERNTELTKAHEELKISYEALIKAKEKAEESDRLKSAFLANMSHEIRTPMNGILGFSALLNDKTISEEQKEDFIDIINQNGNILLKLIDDILDIAKIEAGQLLITEKPVYLNQLLYDEYLLFKKLAETHETKKLSLQLKLPPFNLEHEVMLDTSRIKQILSNLLGNAIKFTENGYIEFGYEVVSPSWIQFYVKDTGIGLPKEKHEVIFDRFRQADESSSRKYGGTGLGLTISLNLVKLMGGTMWVDSEPGKGSVFYFKIPYKPVYENRTPGKIRKSAIKDCNFIWEHSKILIAEDENVNYSYLTEVLKSTNVKIIRAKNGIEALELCKKDPNIDLVLMDIKMPEMNGYTATREIKKIRSDLPIIAQTAYAMEEEINKCFASGCDAYLSKPTDRKKLLFTIDNFLSVKNNN